MSIFKDISLEHFSTGQQRRTDLFQVNHPEIAGIIEVWQITRGIAQFLCDSTVFLLSLVTVCQENESCCSFVSTLVQRMCYVFILYNCVYFVFFCDCMFLIQPLGCSIINEIELS